MSEKPTQRPYGEGMTRYLVLRFEIEEGCSLSDDELVDLGDRIVAAQIDPDPPVLTFDGVEVERR